MWNTDSVKIGDIYWCDTARSNIGARFSGKARRPALVISVRGDYAAVYPCSSFRGDLGASEFVGDVFGETNTYVVYGSGLFYVPVGDLELEGVEWSEWKTWSKTHRKIIESDLRAFEQRHRQRLETPVARRGKKLSDVFSTALSDRLSESLRKKLTTPPPEPPKPPVPPPPKPDWRAPRPLTPREEFERAVNGLAPYMILKPEDDEEPSAPPRSRPRPKERKPPPERPEG